MGSCSFHSAWPVTTTPGEGAFLPTLQYAEFSNRWEVMNVTKGVRNILKNW